MHSRSALASLLLVSAVQGHAQSLGAVQGAVIIGRPLDIVVQSHVAAGDDATSLCVQADVRYGDTRLSPSDVSVTIERDAAQTAGVLRVRARQPVNEPFVTVEVRVGCPMRFARAYTLLADAEPVRPVPTPAAVAAPITAAPARVPPAVPAVSDRAGPAIASAPVARAPAPETPIRSLATAPRPAGVARLASKARPVTAAAPAAREASGAVRTAPEAPATPPGPRLELEPVDIGRGAPSGAPDGAPAPAASVATEASTPPAPPEPAPAVQQELASLRAEQQRLLLAVESLNRELTAAREGRGDGLLYALAGVVLVLLGAVLWLLRRRSAPVVAPAPTPWWTAPGERPEGAVGTPATPSGGDATPPAVASAADGGAPAAPPPPAAVGPVDHMAGLEVSEAGASVFQEVPIAPLDFAALHELWERVDFFESLGQAGDAIAALRAFVQAHPRASEAPYLRWWALARQHGLDTRLPQATYEQHYQRLLAADAESVGVEADPALLAVLAREWPGGGARACVEAALASQPGDPAAPLRVRTLAAFDDLIVLHGVLDLLPVLAQAPLAPTSPAVTPVAEDADAGTSLLDFELPDIADLPPPPATPRAGAGDASPPPAARGGEDGGLDFDFSGWHPPAGTPPPPR